jgi:hypothetical protein
MTEEYGTNSKRIVFSDTDHRHAQLVLRLRHDGLTQAQFFRSLITGYLEGDERIHNYIASISTQSNLKKKQSQRLRQKGKQKVEEMGLSEQQVENIFDLIAEEHPDL